MSRFIIEDLDKLKQVLENHRNPVLEKIYSSYVGSKPTSARVEMYEHQDGCTVLGKPGRWWVYVRVKGKGGIVYDIALWKLMRFREVQELLRGVVSVKDEDRDVVLT